MWVDGQNQIERITNPLFMIGLAIGASSEFKLVKPSCEQLTNVKIGTYDVKSNSQEDVPCLQ